MRVIDMLEKSGHAVAASLAEAVDAATYARGRFTAVIIREQPDGGFFLKCVDDAELKIDGLETVTGEGKVIAVLERDRASQHG